MSIGLLTLFLMILVGSGACSEAFVIALIVITIIGLICMFTMK